MLNGTITLSLEPVDAIPVPLPNSTIINVADYEVTGTIRVCNATIVVFGYLSRLRDRPKHPRLWSTARETM